MANDPFAPVETQAEGPYITFNIKSSGGYDNMMTQVRGTIPELGRIFKVDVEAADNPLWSLILRANDLARAVQADEAKKAAAQGKA